MPPRPRKLKVLGRTYTVRARRLPDAFGQCDGEDGVIDIDPKRCAEPFIAQDTLLHEALHAILRQQGHAYDEHEERLVGALATGLVAVMHDNPKLVEYLTS